MNTLTNQIRFFTRAQIPVPGSCFSGTRRISLIKLFAHGCRRSALALALSAGVLCLTPAARSELSLNLDLYKSFYPPSGQTNWYAWASLNTTNTIATYYQLYSTHSNILDSISAGGTTSTSYFNDFNSLLAEITNGNWTLVLNVGDPSQQTYTFHVTASGLSDSTFPAFQITNPAYHEHIADAGLTYTWSGPTNWPNLYVNVHDDQYNFYQANTLAPDATSWNGNISLDLSLVNYTFNLDYNTNASACMAFSTPVTAGSQPLPDWTTITTLHLDENVDFFLNPVSASGHTNVAHYTFDNSGYLGQDSTANHNDIYCGSGWGAGPSHQFVTDAVAGGGAVQFFGYSSMTPCDQSFTAWTNVFVGSFSLSAWVKTATVVGGDSDGLNDNSGQSVIYLNNSYNNGGGVIPLGLTGSKAAFYTGGYYGSDDTLHSAHGVTTGNYVHLVVTRDQNTGQKSLYVNGVLDASDYGNAGILNGLSDYASIGGSGGSPYVGELDDVQIYAGVLASNEVAYLYTNPGLIVADTTGVPNDFNTALGTGSLVWTTSGDSDWFIETTNTYNGAPAAAQSGSVTGSQATTLSVTVTGPGTLTYFWSSIANDPNGGFYYEFDIDDSYQNDMGGDNDWSQDGPYAIGAGTHTLSWTIYANGDTDPTQAGFLDDVSYVVNTAPVITLDPFDQTNYPGYNVALLAGATSSAGSTISWQWYLAGNPAPIPNATNALYIPTNSGTPAVAGSYYAMAGTPGGSATTTTASVSFVSAPLPPGWAHALKSPFSAMDATTFTKDYYLGCAVDAAGDLYAAAEYVGVMGVLTNGYYENVLASIGTNGDAALVKHDANGNAIWGVGLTNNDASSYSYGECVAPAPGNGAYLLSVLSGTNWLGTNKFVDVAGGSLLLSRFDASGSNVWSRLLAGTNSVSADYNQLVSDATGNVTLVGNMSGTVSVGGTNLAAPSGGGFIVQYDTNGAVRWAETIPVYVYNLAYGNGLLFVALQSGVASGVPYASIGSLSNATDRAWSVACLNAATGQALWLRAVGEPFGANYSGILNDIPLVSTCGTNVFLTANAFGPSVVFGGISVPLPAGRGQYFARYDTNGNPQTATIFGSPTTMIWASAANASGVYVCGDFDDYSQFGNDVIAAPVYGPSSLDFSINGFSFVYFTQPFVAKFDRNGNPLWARNGVSSDEANFRGLATTSDGVWAAGFLKVTDFSSPAQFGTNYVFSDIYVPGGGGLVTVYFNEAGMIAKIAEQTVPANPVTLINPQTTGANFQFQFLSQSSFTHSVQYRTNLVSGLDWQTYSNVTGDGSLKTVSIPLSLLSPGQQGFVRVSTQ